MARKRFNTTERAVIEAAGIGGRIKWQNVTQWHDGEIADTAIRSEGGWQYITVINRSTTKTISAGQRIDVGPGHIRHHAEERYT